MRPLIPSTLLAAVLFAPCPAVYAGILAPGHGSVRIAAEAEPEGAKYVVTLEGMMCGACEHKVKEALGKIEGVVKVDADWHKGTADVALKDPNGVLTLEQVQKALADLKEFTVKEVKKV